MDSVADTSDRPIPPDQPGETGGGAQPRNETLVRVMCAVALFWGIAYLTWRIGWTWRGANPVLYIALLIAELVGWVSLALYGFLALAPRCM